MSISPRLSNKLHDVLGPEAEDLVTWLDEERAHREELNADFAELRQEMRAGFAKLSADVSNQLATQVHGLELRLSERIHAVDKRVAETKADLMKWSFVFWVGAVSAIAILAGVLK